MGSIASAGSTRRIALAGAFRDYKLPLISIREADLESAVTVFARLNRRGRKMAEDQLVSALTYQEGEFHLADMLDEIKAELKRSGFGSLDRIFLLRSVLAALELDIYAKDWADLMIKPKVRERLPEGFEASRSSIRLALETLQRFGVTSDRLLPYGLQLVLLGEFHRICPQPAAGTVELLRRWFWVTSFTGWFGGVNTAQAKRALEEIREPSKGRERGIQRGRSGHAGAAVPRALRRREAPVYAHSCCTWDPFDRGRSSAAPIWIRVRSCPG